MYEQDPDIVRWVLHLLSGERSLYSGSCGSTTQNDLINDNGEYDGNRSVDTDFTTTENDAVIAHALQEELSHVAITEASGCSYAGEEHLQASVVPQYWLGSSVRNLKPAESDSKQGDDMGATSSSNPEDKSYGDEGWSSELSNESLGKRLNQLIPVPHVPRINNEIPSADEATSDYQRLLDRLQLYDLVELKVHGDGNCQFRALSDQFYRTPEHHNFVRQQVVNQLKSHPEIYEGYVPMAYGDYLEKMSKGGEWGDHVTLQAAADSYGMKMFIVTSFKDTCYIEILPHVQKSKKGSIVCALIEPIEGAKKVIDEVLKKIWYFLKLLG